MSKLICIAEHRSNQRHIYFDRRELNKLLSLYSRRVARGEWRDYAIDHGPGMAVFSVFRHSHDSVMTEGELGLRAYCAGLKATDEKVAD